MIIEIKRFIEAVDKQSITKASKSLYITQPALSLSIARLEKRIGTKLFRRFGKRLLLTEDGKYVYQVGLRILKLWEKMKEKKTRRNGGKPVYSIGVFDNASLKLSKYFQKNLINSEFGLEITIERSAQLIAGLRSGFYDLCVCTIPPDGDFGANVQLIKRFSELLYPVSGKIWRTNLKSMPFILYNKGSQTREYIDPTFLKHGIEPNIIVESTSPEFMKELAIGGCGVALLPKNFIVRELEQKKLHLHKLPFVFKRDIGIFINKEGNIRETDQVVKEIASFFENGS